LILSANTTLFASSVEEMTVTESFDKESGEVIFQGYGRMRSCIATTLWQEGIEPDSVKKLLVKDGITILDSYVLMGAYESDDWINLTEMTLPKSIKKIQGDFSRCPSLKIINYAGAKEDWDKIIFRDNQDELFSKLEFRYSVDVPESDKSLSDTAGDEIEIVKILPDKKISCRLDYITEELVVSGKGSLYLPVDLYDTYYSVSNLFYRGSDDNNCNIPRVRDVVIENGITTLCKNNFVGVYNSVVIPKSVTEIESNCFGNSDDNEWYQEAIDNYRESENKKMDVYYEGSEAEWNKIEIGDMNDELINGNLHSILKMRRQAML
ncbi:MAG: leucine-rich repeat domain-containing protein, partial [Eubacterium sp.]|nr:leucine-rich repeat domain-containing protein [Eubacterium sp.]